MNKKVYVANLPFKASEPELKTLFTKAGDVMSVKIVADRQTGQPRGIAFRVGAGSLLRKMFRCVD